MAAVITAVSPTSSPPELVQGHRGLKAIGLQRSIRLDAPHEMQSSGIQLSDQLTQLNSEPVADLRVETRVLRFRIYNPRTLKPSGLNRFTGLREKTRSCEALYLCQAFALLRPPQPHRLPPSALVVEVIPHHGPQQWYEGDTASAHNVNQV